MAEDLERWTERTPHLFNRAPAFGLAREAEQLDGTVPPAPVDEPPRAPRRQRGPFVTYLSMPWSYGDRAERDLWHRIRCRVGRHELYGGHPMHMAGAVVYVERSCRWCGVEPDQDGWNSVSA
ncbi:MAG: hypothetical protein ACR2HM_00195 [Acidimicrobiales bacterium]